MTQHAIEQMTAECSQARQQADTARDLAGRLRGERGYLEAKYAVRRWDVHDRTPETLRALDDAIIFLSALGGQPGGQA